MLLFVRIFLCFVMAFIVVFLPSTLYHNFDKISLITYKLITWDVSEPVKNGIVSGLFVALFVWLLKSQSKDKETKLGSYDREEDTVPKCTNCGFEYVRMTDLRAAYLMEHLCTVFHCPNCNKEICREYHFGIGDRIDEDEETNL